MRGRPRVYVVSQRLSFFLFKALPHVALDGLKVAITEEDLELLTHAAGTSIATTPYLHGPELHRPLQVSGTRILPLNYIPSFLTQSYPSVLGKHLYCQSTNENNWNLHLFWFLKPLRKAKT